MDYRTIGVFILDLAINILSIYSWVVLAYCIMSWIFSPLNKIRRFVESLVDPALYPIRALMGKIFKGGSVLRLDLSPLVLMLVLNLLRMLLSRLAYVLF